MAAEVTGFIGNEQVELNNAATEATLRQLLASTMSANKQSLDALKAFAIKAGIDADTVNRTEEAVSELGSISSSVDDKFKLLEGSTKSIINVFGKVSDVAGKLIDGSASLSNILSTLATSMPPVLSQVVTGFSLLAQFQETNLKAYQTMSDAGVNFGGSLTDMRMAASQSYLTLDEFTRVVKNNSAALAMMGGTTDQGAREFSKFTNGFIKSDIGNQMLSLGYSFEDINTNTLAYIQMTGGRTAAEMNNTKQLSLGTQTYLEELDRLSQLTGKSRAQQQQELQKISLDAGWQAFMSSQTGTAKDLLTKGLAEANSISKEAAQNFQATTMGFTVWNKDTAIAAGLNREAFEYQRQIAVVATNTTMSEVEKRATIEKLGSESRFATAQRAAANESQLRIIAARNLPGAETARSMLAQLTLARDRQINSIEDQIKFDQSAGENQRRQKESEATNAAEVAKTLKDLGTSILSGLLPVVKTLTPALQFMADHIKTTALIIGGLAGAVLAFKSFLGAGGSAGKLEGLVKVFGEYGHSQVKPLWVRDWKDGAGIGRASTPASNTPAGGSSSGRGGYSVGRTAGLGIGGLALGAAGNVATESGYERTGALFDIGATALDYAAIAGPIALALGPETLGLSIPVIEGLAAATGAVVGTVRNWEKLMAPSKDNEKPAKISYADQKLIDEINRLTKLQEESNRLAKEHKAIAEDHLDLDANKPASVADSSNNRPSNAKFYGAMRPASS